MSSYYSNKGCYLVTKHYQSYAQDTFEKDDKQRKDESSLVFSVLPSASLSCQSSVSDHKRQGCYVMDGNGASYGATLLSSCSFSIQPHSKMTAWGGNPSPSEQKHHILPASPSPHCPPMFSDPDPVTLLYFYVV